MDSDIDLDSEIDSDSNTDTVKSRTRTSTKLCLKESSGESFETSSSVESETESLELEYNREELVSEAVNADKVASDNVEDFQIERSPENSKSLNKKRKSAFEIFSGQEWDRINASRQVKPQREELVGLSKVNLSF